MTKLKLSPSGGFHIAYVAFDSISLKCRRCETDDVECGDENDLRHCHLVTFVGLQRQCLGLHV